MGTLTTPIGCAFLNQPSSLNSGGWASLNGEEPFRFTTLETLAARGELWVVSTPPSTFLTDDGSKYPFLRNSEFLATPVNFIAQELGVGGHEAAPIAVQRVSEVLTRVVEMADSLSMDVRTRLVSGQVSLVSVLQAAVAPALRHEEMPQDLLDAMPALFKSPAPISAPHGQDIGVRVPANRMRLAQVVMLSAVPAGSWTEVDLSLFPNPAGALSWAISNQQPVICNVTVRGPLPKVKGTAPLMRNLTTGATRWMALPEIIALSRLVEMTPKRIFIASEFVPAQASLRVPPPAFSPAAAASISAGLFAEAYMHAACSTAALRLADYEEFAVQPQVYSVRAAWLTAVTRSYMMQEAMALAEANFNVIGFSNSHVWVGVSRRNLRVLRKAIAASSLLSYPTSLRLLEEKLALPKVVGEVPALQGEG
tara:strand:- start:30 stop:1298 length:1269 start_codon:yes stop_codon:yes gene_type:complete